MLRRLLFWPVHLEGTEVVIGTQVDESFSNFVHLTKTMLPRDPLISYVVSLFFFFLILALRPPIRMMMSLSEYAWITACSLL